MTALNSQEVERFRNFAEASFGLHFGQDDLAQLSRVFLERLRRTGCSQPAAYWERLATVGGSRAELRHLAAELTVPETYFYRHPEQYQAFAEIALHDRVMDVERRGPVRILSAGCASGEEAYSLAAITRDHLGPSAARDVEIVGIDINPLLLDKARRARYSAWSLRATGDDQRHRHFQIEGRDFVLHDVVRTAVTFEERNLLNGGDFWTPGAFDIVLCRNVMIYFAPETVRAVVARLAGCLVPGGYLFLGPSETLRGVSQDFNLCHTHGAFYYQRHRSAESQGRSKNVAGTARPVAATVFRHSFSSMKADDSWFGAIDKSSQRITILARELKSRTFRDVPSRAAHKHMPSAAASRQWDLTEANELLRRERFSDVVETLGALPPESEMNSDVLLLRAVALTSGGNLGETERVCLRVLAMDESNPGAHYLMALCREQADDEAGAVEHDRIAVALDPSFAMPRLHMGLLARRRGDLEMARRELREARLLLSRENSGRILLFGGGFTRDALVQLCRSTLRTCESES